MIKHTMHRLECGEYWYRGYVISRTMVRGTPWCITKGDTIITYVNKLESARFWVDMSMGNEMEDL